MLALMGVVSLVMSAARIPSVSPKFVFEGPGVAADCDIPCLFSGKYTAKEGPLRITIEGELNGRASVHIPFAGDEIMLGPGRFYERRVYDRVRLRQAGVEYRAGAATGGRVEVRYDVGW
ncbi:MAG: hypothetical protein AAGB00_12320 [Planctomycetota bacterium]